MADQTPTPARSLDEATAALDFEQPLHSGDGRYQDLSAARGDRVMERIARRFQRKQGGRYTHLVFASHRGAGKSTELLQLAHALRDRYLCVYLEANVEMDAYTIEMEDLLLVLARTVEERLRGAGMPLDADLLRQISAWFAEVIDSTEAGRTYVQELQTEASAGAQVPPFGGLMARLTSLFRVESSYREQVKSVLRKYPGTLMDSVNRLLDAAHQALKGGHGKELLIVIDNLDRYDPKVIDELMVRGGDRFGELHCNLILTPPISLLYRPGDTGSLADHFLVEVMPAIRLRDRGQDIGIVSDPGRDLLLRALGKRIDVARLIPEAAVCDRLVLASGGSIRALLQLTSDATLEAAGEVLTGPEVERAVARHRARMRDTINANGWWAVLVDLHLRQQITESTDCLRVLYHRLAFKYDQDFWYDIHPLVAEMQGFRDALERWRREHPSPVDGA